MGISASELRIGNYYHFISWNIDAKLTEEMFKSNGFWRDFYNKLYSPIPITGEWLVKFGFENKNGVFHKELYDNCHFIRGYLVEDYFSHAIDEYDSIGDRESVSLIYIKYVHQLQNLYFALTGKELTII